MECEIKWHRAIGFVYSDTSRGVAFGGFFEVRRMQFYFYSILSVKYALCSHGECAAALLPNLSRNLDKKKKSASHVLNRLFKEPSV
jgi:hypothetical protein